MIIDTFLFKKVPTWSGCVTTTYGTLKENDIIKITNKNFTQYFSFAYALYHKTQKSIK